MDLNTVVEIRDARHPAPWRPGDVWLGGGTYLFSEPQPHLRRLVDLSRTGWTPARLLPDGSLEIAATCTIARLSGGNLCNALPAGPMISLTAALDTDRPGSSG